MALGDLVWQRNALINDTTGRSHAELTIASVAANERLERVTVDFYCNVVSGSSAVLQTWLDRGVLVIAQWTQAAFGTPPTPVQVGTANLSLADVLADGYVRMGEAETFTDWHHVPKAGVLTIDAVVRRQPPAGGSGRVWLTWGLAAFAGAGVAVGFDKIYSRVQVSTVA